MSGFRFRPWGAAATESAPAALLGVAVAFAVATLLQNGGLAAAAAPVVCGIAVSALAWWVVRSVGDGDLTLPAFDAPPLEFSEESPEPEELLLTEEVPRLSDESADDEELLLTDTVPLPVQKASEHDELLLEDILESLRPESRVVRLFDSKSMPTAGELRRRIEQHLACEPPRLPPPDASAELREAIAALRQSLR